MSIDVATGQVHRTFNDLVVPGKVPLTWIRRYATAILGRPAGIMGPGWASHYSATLTRHPGGFEYVTPTGTTELLPDPDRRVERGESVRHLGAFLEVLAEEGQYVVQSWDVDTDEVWRYCFSVAQHGPVLRLSSVEDATGQAIDLLWNVEQRRLDGLRQRAEGRELRLQYDSAARVRHVALRDDSGLLHPVANYEYDLRGRLVVAEDAAGFCDRFEYDDEHRLVREVLKDGGIYHYRYDGQGRCIRRSGLNHYNERRLRFLDATRITEVINSHGATWRYERLSNGQITRTWSPAGALWQTSYDPHGRIAAKTDPQGNVTQYQYDDCGNRACTVSALGHKTSYTYNARHQPVSMLDASGHLWTRAYDSHHRLVRTVDPLGATWSFSYDEQGDLAEDVDPVGARKRYRYRSGVLISVTDSSEATVRFDFDAFGRVTQRRGALGDATSLRYDRIGNPVQVTLPDGATLRATYDHAGNMTSFVDANGRITRWRYGPCSRLLERVDALGHRAAYLWGSEPNRLERVVNEKGEVHEFTHDDAGRVNEERFFDGGTRSYSYDELDRITGYTNAIGQTVQLDRDAVHRVVRQRLPDGGFASFSFDALGHVVEASNECTTVRFERDPLGRIVSESQGGQWVTITKYDLAGNPLETRTNAGHEARYEFDLRGQLSKVHIQGHGEIAFGRNCYGQETTRRLPGDVQHTQQHDVAGRLVQQRIALASPSARHPLDDGNTLVSRSYSYDGNGTLTSLSDARWGSTRYAYDPADHVIQALRSTGTSEKFDYDAAGNVSEMHEEGTGAAKTAMEYGPGNQLVRRGNTRFEYDAEGRRVKAVEELGDGSSKTWTYQWNALDRLISVSAPDGAVWRYAYDALARRISKQCANPSDGQVHKQFIWDKDVIVQELDRGQAKSSWVMAPYSFEPLASIQEGRLYSAVNDHLGTPYCMVGTDGSIGWTVPRRTWGQPDAAVNAASGSASCPWRFQGQWFDEESGLAYSRYRYYSANDASFISRDPIGLAGGLNSYWYGPNPVNWIDPLGLAFASGRGPHEATATVWRPAPDGNSYQMVSQEPYRSGNMTPDEAALGFPRSSLATHTENRAARTTPLQPGDVMVIHGQYPPCSSCRGAMNRSTAAAPGARVVYLWRDEETGEMRRWSSINGARCRGG